MLTSILAASDLSSRSVPAVWRALHLAQLSGARLGLLHVVEDDQPAARMREDIRSAEDFLSAQVSEFGILETCEVFTRAGSAFLVIANEARAREAELIVMGAHRRRVLQDVFIGTTIERVIRTAGRPVLMANSKTDRGWRKIYIATDMSETSRQAAHAAVALGFLDGANVTFLHAYPPITREMMAHAGIAGERVEQEASREFEKTEREVVRFIQELGIDSLNYSARLVEGYGAPAIAGVVEQAKPDLLVIGTRGLSGVKRLFLGSVAHELMSSLEIDILAVPPTA